MNLISAVERLAASDRSLVTFHADRCLHSREKNATCSACYEICPARAIQAGAPPKFNREACQRCQACLSVCPTNAYTGLDLTTELLESVGHAAAPEIELVCEVHPAPQTGASARSVAIQTRGCLAGVGVGSLVALAALGVRRAALRTDACAQCPWGAVLLGRIQAQVAEAQTILSIWGQEGLPITLHQIENPVKRAVHQVSAPTVSRREIFRFAARQGYTTLAHTLTSEETTRENKPSRDRILALRTSASLPAPTALPQTTLDGEQYTLLQASDACTACNACARACPTGALVCVLDKESRQFRLNFYPQTCVNCGICLRSCAPQALSRAGQPTLEQVYISRKPILLQSGGLTRCEGCNAWIAARPGQQAQCPVCQYRQNNPFGSYLRNQWQRGQKKNDSA